MSIQSEQIGELMTALAKAQGEIGHASRDSANPFFKSKYADLGSVWDACRAALSKNGLAVTQTLDLAGERQVLITTLGHSSGQWMKSLMAMPVLVKPQEVGSCVTYYRRYALAAMVGVYQSDDDAETASKATREAAHKEQPKPMPMPVAKDEKKERPKATKEQLDRFFQMRSKVKSEAFQDRLDSYLTNTLELQEAGDMHQGQWAIVMKTIEKELKEQESSEAQAASSE
jgi:hypothetical protein